MKVIRFILKILYLWFWAIPIQFGMLAFIGYFGLIYVFYGTISVSEIKMILGKNETAFFLCFWLPFAIPMLLSLGSIFSNPVGTKGGLNEALKFRNGQMGISSDKQASEILRKTNYLDMLNSNDSEVFNSARRGFEARYNAKPPTEVFKDLMNED